MWEGRGVDATTAALLSTLTDQREHVLGILEGLDDEALLRPVLPTGWSCAGLVQHLAVDVERFWFRAVMSAELVVGPEEVSAWVVAEGTQPADVLALYRDEIALADAVISPTPFDSPPLGWPADLFGSWRLPDLRAVLLHVIVETACHAGHLDAARELLDGRTWLIL